jgi:hypothetical protein
MKRTNIFFAILFAVACTFCFAGTSEAFHDGGVAYCEGYHTMHNSMDGKAVTTNLPQYQGGSLSGTQSTADLSLSYLFRWTTPPM